MIQLHLHTRYSVGDGLPSSADYAKAAGEGSVLAITDHDTLAGIVEHQKKCEKYGVRPLFGVEHTTKEGFHLTLIAKNQRGLSNLFYLCSAPGREIDPDGLICLSGDLMGPLSTGILKGDRDEVLQRTRELKEKFGDDFYIEIIDHPLREYKKVNKGLRWLAKRFAIKTVETNDVHYISRDDVHAQSVLVCDSLGVRLGDSGLYQIPDNHWLKPIEATAVHREILDKIDLTLEFGKYSLPDFPLPSEWGKDEFGYLSHLVQKGLEERGCNGKEFVERARFELGVINAMGFSGYFLIVWDFIDWAHRNGIPVGPGRGSGAGSLVAYALKITGVQPLKYDLLFERFLNPDRVSMPDFDIDFGQSGRAAVIEYVTQKYGEDAVAQIATFSAMKPRAAFKSAHRVMRLGRRFEEATRISKMLPDAQESGEMVADPVHMDDLFEEDGSLKAVVGEKYEALRSVTDMQDVFCIARQLEDSYRSIGRHAAGIIIVGGNILDVIPAWDCDASDPTHKDDEDRATRLLSQLDKDCAEAMGAVKFDFLGLKELDVLQLCQEWTGVNPDTIPLDDSKVFELLSAGDTLGVFQMSSVGLAQFLQELRPRRFADIVAATSLYRPGPKDMDMHLVFARRANGEEDVSYLHPLLEPILGETYGVIVYQEQVMRIVQDLAGYTLAGADLLRRAMGKKKFKEMEKQQEIFINGCSVNGIDKELSLLIWDQLAAFARYGFNKSHAVAYSMITYWTAWFKVHYRAELLAAQMQVRNTDVEIISEFVRDARASGVVVKDPDLRWSDKDFKVVDGEIISGFCSVKSIGDKFLDQLNYRPIDVFDFVDAYKPNKRTFEMLVNCGALDYMIGTKNRRRVINSIDNIRNFIKKEKKNINQVDLFGGPPKPDLTTGESFSYLERIWREFDALGRFSTGHPTLNTGIYGLKSIANMGDEEVVIIAALVKDIKEHTTKSGELMAFVKIEDFSGIIDMTMFSSDYIPGMFEEKKVYCFYLKKNVYNGKEGVIYGSHNEV